MKTQMIKLITIVSLVVTASSPRIAIADGKELTIDLSLVPQAVEFEGFINYGRPIQLTTTNALGQTITGVITPNVINQPIFSTRKVLTSVSIFDGQPVVLGGLIREEVQKDADTADTGGASHLQKLLKERDQLKQRLIEVEALINKNAKD